MSFLKGLVENKKSLTELKIQKACIDCGITISDKRLNANPESTRCISCQEDHEEELEISFHNRKKETAFLFLY